MQREPLPNKGKTRGIDLVSPLFARHFANHFLYAPAFRRSDWLKARDNESRKRSRLVALRGRVSVDALPDVCELLDKPFPLDFAGSTRGLGTIRLPFKAICEPVEWQRSKQSPNLFDLPPRNGNLSRLPLLSRSADLPRGYNIGGPIVQVFEAGKKLDERWYSCRHAAHSIFRLFRIRPIAVTRYPLIDLGRLSYFQKRGCFSYLSSSGRPQRLSDAHNLVSRVLPNPCRFLAH